MNRRATCLLLALVLPALATSRARGQVAPSDPTPAADLTVPAPRPVTLAEAVEMARANAPRLVEARGRTRVGSAQTRSSMAAFLPSLSLSAAATRQLPAQGDRTRIENGQVIVLPAEPWSFNTGISANLQLFDGGRRIHELRQARAVLGAAEAGEVSDRFAAELEAKQQYFNVLAWREAQAAARAQTEQAEQQFRTAALRVRAGSATRSDSLRSEIQLRNARLAITEAENNLLFANASLTRAVGAPHPVTASGEDTLGIADLPIDEVGLSRLLENVPIVRQARADLEAARAGRQASRSAYWPTLSAGYTYTGSGTDSEFGFGDDPFSYNGSLRFSLSLPLFNQLDREEQVVRAEVAEDNAEAALRDARLAARAGLAQYLAVYRTAAERVQAQTASLRTAEEDLRVQQRRYEVGASTLLDLLTSQTQVNEAREALIRARFDQRVAKAQLEALVGRAL